jgi:FixJ family two-component response regulator
VSQARLGFASHLQINVSSFGFIVSRSPDFLQINLSRKRQFLRAEALAFASHYKYESRVLQMVTEGHSYRQIAQKLHLSKTTVNEIVKRDRQMEKQVN